MGIFDNDNITVSAPSEEPSKEATPTNTEETVDEVTPPEAEGNLEQKQEQIVQAPEAKGNATVEADKRLANRFETEKQLDKGIQGLANFLGYTVDVQNMSLADKEAWYIEKRKEMSEAGKSRATQKNQAEPEQTQTEYQQKTGELDEIKLLLSRALQANKIQQPQHTQPNKTAWDMDDGEFSEWVYSNPKAALKHLLELESGKLGNDLRGFLEPLSEARKEVEERKKWQGYYTNLKARYNDFDDLKDDIAGVYDSNPNLGSLGQTGLELAYQLAKRERETTLLKQKYLEAIEKEAEADDKRIEAIKKGTSISNANSLQKPIGNKPLTEEDIVKQQILGTGQKRGIFDF